MASDSKIEWTDTTWNPVVGCTKVSEGCRNCYAMRMSQRLAAMAEAEHGKAVEAAKDVDAEALPNVGRKHHYTQVVEYKAGKPLPQWNNHVELVPEALTDPLGWKRPRRVFVNSMSDLFHKDVPFEFIDQVFAVMALCPQHTFQILTKRIERAAEYFADLDRRRREWDADEAEHEEFLIQNLFDENPLNDDAIYHASLDWLNTWNKRQNGWPLPNVWLGTSVEDQKAADERIPHLLRCPAAVRFLSCEPLLGAVDLRRWSEAGLECSDDACGWAGNESDCERSDETGIETSEDWYFHCPRCGMETGHTPIDETLGGRNGIHWVIVGGESGPGSRPMHPDWARGLRDQCQAAGVPFFFKQWGDWKAFAESGSPIISTAKRDRMRVIDQHGSAAPFLDWRENPRQFALMRRVGKKAAGRLLDGREWNEMPDSLRSKSQIQNPKSKTGEACDAEY